MHKHLSADHVREMSPISAFVSRYVDLEKSGRHFKAKCPFHDDRRPSFSVTDDIGLFNCFGCKAGGDVFAFIMTAENVGFREAVEIVANGDFSAYVPPAPTKPTKGSMSDAAKRLWGQTRPITGTIAERYLVDTRGIDPTSLPDDGTLRFDRLAYEGDGRRHPALVAAVRDASGNLTGIQRTYLTETAEKLSVASPKMSLGNIKGNAIQLGRRAEELIVCEGLEDGLSIRQLVPSATVWVAAGAGMMKHMLLPSNCRSVIIAIDNDAAGRTAGQNASDVFTSQGKRVAIWSPEPPFKDFNEYAQEAVR